MSRITASYWPSAARAAVCARRSFTPPASALALPIFALPFAAAGFATLAVALALELGGRPAPPLARWAPGPAFAPSSPTPTWAASWAASIPASSSFSGAAALLVSLFCHSVSAVW